jgi:hypothetical protein
LCLRTPEVILVECIDQVLVDLLGHRAREAIYDHLERRYYMSRDEIPRRLVEFCSVLDINFGKGGHTIERTIARRFYSKLEKKFTDYPGYTLLDYVEQATQSRNGMVDLPITTTTVTTRGVSDADQNYTK